MAVYTFLVEDSVTPTRASSSVAASGGTVTAGGVTATFPAGALQQTSSVTLSVAAQAPAVVPPSGTMVLTKTIQLSAGAAQLQQPVTLEVTPTSAELSAAGGSVNQLSVGMVRDGAVQSLPTTVTQEKLRATVDAFGSLTLLAATEPGPTLTAPAMGAQLTTLGPELRWTNPAGTKWFQLQVVPFNLDGPGINLIIGDPAQVTAARYQVQASAFGSAQPNYVMLPDLLYVWRVRTAGSDTAPEEGDWTAWSTGSFTTASASSGTITLTSPAPGGVMTGMGPATLQWQNSNPTVFYYEVQVSGDERFDANPATATSFVWWNLIHGGETTPANSWQTPTLEAGKTYHWRVHPRIQGDGTPVAWSATSTFRTPAR